MLREIKLRDFRCFSAFAAAFEPGINVIVGPNARGKTSLLEAVFVLARLQSPRVPALAVAVAHGRPGFLVDGWVSGRHLQFYYGQRRKKIALDGEEQKGGQDYLEVARAIWFSNADALIVRGGAEHRRKFLDFVGGQIDPVYRRHWRAYDRALRSRNLLLKDYPVCWAEVAAFDAVMCEAGDRLGAGRAGLVERLRPIIANAHAAVAGPGDAVAVEYLRGDGGNLAAALAGARADDARLRQTTVGPHRDDVRITLNGLGAELGSEGQQRTLAAALRLAQAGLIREIVGRPPMILVDDIFGELDPARRNALLQSLPDDAQRIIATTSLAWCERVGEARVGRIGPGTIDWGTA